MRKPFLLFVLSFFLFSPDSKSQVHRLHSAFVQPPDSVQLAVYWYWLSDHISKEGVVRDLQSMKKAGINRAFIGNIQADGIPLGSIKMFSKAWWEVLHTALKTATELNIEIGIFNSPGWSQSGGPWIKPSQSMRYLASKEITVNGPINYFSSLPEVGSNAQDVKVLAYPVEEVEEFQFNFQKVKNTKGAVEMKVSKPVNTLIIQPAKKVKTSATLLRKENGTYIPVKSFEIDRSNTALNVGFMPMAPVVIAIPGNVSQEYKLEFEAAGEADFTIKLTSEVLMERYAEKTFAKMFPTPLPLWGDYLWDEQPEATTKSILKDRVQDITSNLNNGKLSWKVPEGRWKIVRYAMMTTGVTNSPATPEATGLEVDKLSNKHTAAHFDAFIGEILRRIPEKDRKSFKVVVQDSYETGGQNWTDDMIESFKKRYSYDPTAYLPVLEGNVVGSRNESDRFLWDLRRLIADRVAYDYVGGLRKESHKHGLSTWLENYGHWGFPSEFMMYGGQSDEISGEYWSEGSLGDIENKAAASTAHVYGKRKVWAESFTAAGKEFARYPYLMKQRGDRFFTEGINATLLHLFVHQPYEDKLPGMNAWFGNEFNRKNIWFEQFDLFGDYLKRCNFMLQQGRYIAEVAYFIGEDVPKMTGITEPELPKGYSYDYINAEILMQQASVVNGHLKLKSGMEYRVLVLPKLTTMRPELLSKILQMVNEGLVILGPSPLRSPSLQDHLNADKKVKDLSAALWSGVEPSDYKKRGKGLVFGENNTLTEVFKVLNLNPDFAVDNIESDIRFIHRSLGDTDLYFLSNQQENKVSFKATFRTDKGKPYLWDALTGERRALSLYKNINGFIEIQLELEPLGSAFIVFENTESSPVSANSNFPSGKILQKLDKSWTVKFTGLDAPEGEIVFPKLIDLTTSTNDNIKHFSGKAEYTTTFQWDINKEKPVYVDLGKVMVMAKVYINDQYAGGVWTYPYRVNVSEFIKAGDNKLKVEVVNNWKNKLISDKKLPESERKTWAPVNNLKANSELQSSGLLGPVSIQEFDY